MGEQRISDERLKEYCDPDMYMMKHERDLSLDLRDERARNAELEAEVGRLEYRVDALINGEQEAENETTIMELETTVDELKIDEARLDWLESEETRSTYAFRDARKMFRLQDPITREGIDAEMESEKRLAKRQQAIRETMDRS